MESGVLVFLGCGLARFAGAFDELCPQAAAKTEINTSKVARMGVLAFVRSLLLTDISTSLFCSMLHESKGYLP